MVAPFPPDQSGLAPENLTTFSPFLGFLGDELANAEGEPANEVVEFLDPLL
jgi:hypothetical protein